MVRRLNKWLLICLGVVAFFAGPGGDGTRLRQAVCYVLLAAALLFLAGLNWAYIAGAGVLAVPAVYFFVVRVPYRWERILAWWDHTRDPLGAGWHISQSLTALGSGGIFGLGLGASKQKMFFLPESHNDFIFAVVGEELGLIGAALTAVAFLVFLYRGMRIALRAPDLFGFYLGIGITFMIALQALANISMVLAMVPTKGLALPFISQGGSSLMLNLAATGILLNISHYGEEA